MKHVLRDRLTVALTILFATCAFAYEDRWLYKAKIETSPSNPMQKIELPESFQSLMSDNDLNRIKVVDHSGNLIPSIVKAEQGKQVPSVDHPLGIFPLYKETNQDQKNTLDLANIKFSYDQGKVEVNVGKNASMVTLAAMETENEKPKNNIATPVSYILENPQYNQDNKPDNFSGELQTLTLDWHDDFEGLAALQVQTSANLSQWSTIVEQDNIANMNFMGQKLYKNKISIPMLAGRYIKIDWIAGDQQHPTFHKVTGTWSQPAKRPAYTWSRNLKLTRVKTTDKNKVPDHTFEFTVSPSFKADRFRLVSQADNLMFSGSLSVGSRGLSDNNTSWRTLSDFKFYRVMSNAGEIALMDKPIAPNQNFHWRIYFDYPVNFDIDDIGVQVTRYPLTLYFLAQEGQAYYLIYDSNGVSSEALNHKTIVSSVLTLGKSEAATANLSNPQYLTPTIEADGLNWKKILLWLVLVGGVILMLGMARRLAKELAIKADE